MKSQLRRRLSVLFSLTVLFSLATVVDSGDERVKCHVKCHVITLRKCDSLGYENEANVAQLKDKNSIFSLSVCPLRHCISLLCGLFLLMSGGSDRASGIFETYTE